MIIQLSLERGNDVEGRDMSSWLQFGCGTCAMSWLIRVRASLLITHRDSR